MKLVRRFLWLLIMVLGVVCIVFGGFMAFGGQNAKAEVVDGFNLTRVKYYDFSTYNETLNPADITWEYKDVNSEQDIEDILDNIKEQRYFMEDMQGIVLGELAPGESYTPENKKSDDVKYDLYFAFNGGEAAKEAGDPFVGYIPTIDGQLAFGAGKIALGMSKLMEYTGIALIVVGSALVLMAIILLLLGMNLKRREQLQS